MSFPCFNLSLAFYYTLNKIQILPRPVKALYVLTPVLLPNSPPTTGPFSLSSVNTGHFYVLTQPSFCPLQNVYYWSLYPKCFSPSFSHGWLIADSSSKSDQMSPHQKDLPQPPCLKASKTEHILTLSLVYHLVYFFFSIQIILFNNNVVFIIITNTYI